MKKETKKNIISLAIILGTIFGSIGGFYGISVLVLGTTMPYSVVMSPSMKPTLNEGDIIVVRHVPEGEIQVNDIIVFWAKTWGVDDPGVPVVHRVINIVYSGGTWYETKGDNNPGSDPLTPYGYVIGKVVYIIRYLGIPAYFLQQTGGTTLIIILIIAIVVILIYVTLKGDEEVKKENSKEEKDNGETKPDL